MKRGLFILLLGAIVAAAAYGGMYLACTSSARNMERTVQPELAWLKDEFHLSDAEFKRVSELHAAYLPQCQEMCRKIDEQNAQLAKLLQGTAGVTPEIEQALKEAARLRVECQTMMLRHFVRVSQTMPSDEGSRYLSWVKEKALQSDYGMNQKP
jgi:hypothetical protein